MNKHKKLIITLLRLSLALIFIWFGLLKVFGFNPVHSLIASVTPMLAEGNGLILLGAFETLIGIGLLVDKLRKITHILLVLHLSGTFLTFITGTTVVFQPYFPVLTLEGEFVLKNLTLALAGLAVLVYGKEVNN